jgi:elongation factor Tu
MASGVGNAAKPHLVIGTIGEKGVGKTSLASAIVRVLSDTGGSVSGPPVIIARDEACGFEGVETSSFEFETEARRYTFLDTPAPGRIWNKANVAEEIASDERSAMAMNAAVRMDGAVYVVAADQMDRSVDCVLLAREAGVPALLVFMNKVDALPSKDYVPPFLEELGSTLLEYDGSEIAHLLAHQGFPAEGLPVIHGSALLALQGDGGELGRAAILELLAAIDAIVPERRETGIMSAEDLRPGDCP